MGKMRRQHMGGSGDKASQPTQNPAVGQENTQSEGNSWLHQAGNWLGSKYDSVTQSIGNFANRTGQAASDFMEAVRSTDIDFQEDGTQITTDLDEVMDVVPGLIGDKLQLDKEASDNQINVFFGDDGTIKLKTGSLAISSMNIAGMSLENGRADGVEITIRREKSGFLPSFDLDESQVHISVTSLIGNNVVYQTDDGPVHASKVAINRMSMSGTGKQAPFDDAVQGSMDFKIDSIDLYGFGGLETQGESLSISQASGTLGPDSGQIAANSISAAGVLSGKSGVSSADLGGITGSFERDGAGEMQGTLKARNAAMNGMNADGIGHFNNATAQEISISSNSTFSDTEASVGQLNASGMDTNVVDADSLSATDLLLKSENGAVSGDLGSLNASGIDSQFVDAASLDANAIGFDLEGSKGNIESQNLQINQLDTQNFDANEINARGFNVGFDKNSSNYTVEKGNLSGIKAADTSIDSATLNSGYAAFDGSDFSANIGSMQADGIDTGTVAIGSVSATGLDASGNISKSLKGDFQASTLQAQNIESGQVAIGSVQADGVAATHNDGLTQASVASANSQNINIENAHIHEAGLNNLNIQANQNVVSGNVASANMTGLDIDGIASIGEIQATELSGNASANEQNLNINSITATNTKEEIVGGKAGLLHAEGVNLNQDQQGFGVKAGVVMGQDAQWEDLSVGEVKLHGVDNRIENSNIDGRIESASFNEAAYSDLIAVNSGNINQLHFQGNQESIHASVDNGQFHNATTNLAGTKANLSEFNLNDIKTEIGEDSVNLNVGNAGINGLDVDSEFGSASMNQAAVENGSLQIGNEIGFSAENASATGIQVNSSDLSAIEKTHTVASENTTSSHQDASNATEPMFNTDRLVETTGKRLDNAQLQGHVGLNSGKHEVAKFLGIPINANVKEGTQLDGNINIVDNRLTDGSSLMANRSIKVSPLASADGVEMNDGQLTTKGSFLVGGRNISEDINESRGLSGKNLQSIGDLTQSQSNNGSASQDNASASGQSNGSGSSGGGGGGSSWITGLINTNDYNVEGHAQLSDGLIDGGAFQANLQSENEHDNKVEVSADPNRFAAQFARFMASSFSINTGSGQADTGQAVITNANVEMNPQDSSIDGSIGAVNVKSISGTAKR